MDLGQKLTVLLFLLPAIIVLTCPSETQAGCCCPTLWTAYRRHCYRLFSHQETWDEAEAFCKSFTVPSLGYGEADRASLGHLASIHSRDEHDFVVTLFDSSRIKEIQVGTASTVVHGWLWLGFHDTTSEGAYEWSDGSPFDYSLWAPNQPDNSGGREDCGHLRSDYGYKWNDLPCDYTAPSSVAYYTMCKLPIW